MATKTEDHPSTGSLIFRHEKAGILDILSLLFLRRSLTSYKFVESSGKANLGVEDITPDPLIALVLVVQKFLSAISTPLKWLGWIVEFFINFISLNHGIFGLIWRLLTCSVVVPNREKANYRSIIGHIDGRSALYKRNTLINFMPSMDSQLKQFDGIDLPDLSALAAKIAYENEAYIKSVVTIDWKMHFVGFYNCWNKYLNDNTTQAFIFTNKEKDADLIVLAFRGTEPFNALDWSTDVDLSRIFMGKMGQMHLGFLKALGLQDDKDYTKGFPDQINTNPDKPVAYYCLRDELTNLLKEHTNAKILVTGHSLGGALAIVFPALLGMHNENHILNSFYGVVTYGQPRVGDAIFGSFVEILMRLNYHRMVYRYDVVPRVPFDITLISPFKHSGTCIYYDGWYKGQMVDEVPNLNYFDLKYVPSMYLNAWGDLLKALFIGKTQGKEFKEGYVSILYRGFGLIIPGIASHSPRDYVNAGRLAKITPKDMV